MCFQTILLPRGYNLKNKARNILSKKFISDDLERRSSVYLPMGKRKSEGVPGFACGVKWLSVFVTSPAWPYFASLNREAIVLNKLRAYYL